MTLGGRPSLQDEKASVSVVVAAVMLLSCVLALVVADLLMVVAARSRAQAAADAAALAAAQELVLPSRVSPTDAATAYASLNGSRLVSCRCAAGTLEAIVEVEMPVRLMFLGREPIVRASARAVVEAGPPSAPA